MLSYTKDNILELVEDKTGLSQKDNPVEYRFFIDYLDFLADGDGFGEKEREIRSNITSELIRCSNSFLQLQKINRDLKSDIEALRLEELNLQEEYKKSNRFVAVFVDSQGVLDSKKRIRDLRDSISVAELDKSELERSIDKNVERLNLIKVNLSNAKKYCNDNFSFCNEEFLSSIDTDPKYTRASLENKIIDNYMKMLESGFINPADPNGWQVSNTYGQAIIRLKNELSEHKINKMREAVEPVTDNIVEEYLQYLSRGDSDMLEEMRADKILLYKLRERFFVGNVIELYASNPAILYNRDFCDVKRIQAERNRDALDLEINELLKPYQNNKRIKEEAETYFRDNFKDLYEIGVLSDEQSEFKKNIKDKYIEMRHKGFGRPEDNNGITANVTRIFGLGRNIIGEEILRERSELANQVVEIKVNQYVATHLKSKEFVLSELVGDQAWEQLLALGFKEIIILALKKEAYDLPDIKEHSKTYAENEAYKISASTAVLEQYCQEALAYFGDINSKSSVAYLASRGGEFGESSPEFVESKNFIISNFIMMKCKLSGLSEDLFAFLSDNSNKDNINEKIIQLINENVNRAVEDNFDIELNNFKEHFRESWSFIESDKEIQKVIEDKIKAKIKVSAYKEMQKNNYSHDANGYCTYYINKIKTEAVFDELDEQISLYMVISEKLNKIKAAFKKENEIKGVQGVTYISQFDKMSIEERFRNISDILKIKNNKKAFDLACSDLLLSKTLTVTEEDAYREKYLEKKRDTELKMSEDRDRLWKFFQGLMNIPQKEKELQEYLLSWTEWLVPYSKQIYKLHGIFGDKTSLFFLNNVIIPYYNNILTPIRNITNRISMIFKKDISFFEKILHLISDNLYKKYEKSRYGYQNHEHFYVKGAFRDFIKDKHGGERVEEIEAFGKKVGKELDDIEDRIAAVKKEIAANPELDQKTKKQDQDVMIDVAAGYVGRNYVGERAGNFFGRVLKFIGLDRLIGVSNKTKQIQMQLKELQTERQKLEVRKEVLNNAWEKMTHREDNESDFDYDKRISQIQKDTDRYIDQIVSHNYNEEIRDKGLNVSGVGSFHERFNKHDEIEPEPAVSKSKLKTSLALDDPPPYSNSEPELEDTHSLNSKKAKSLILSRDDLSTQNSESNEDNNRKKFTSKHRKKIKKSTNNT